MILGAAAAVFVGGHGGRGVFSVLHFFIDVLQKGDAPAAAGPGAVAFAQLRNHFGLRAADKFDDLSVGHMVTHADFTVVVVFGRSVIRMGHA